MLEDTTKIIKNSALFIFDRQTLLPLQIIGMDDINLIKLISNLDNQIVKIAAIFQTYSYVIEFDSNLHLSNGRNLADLNAFKSQTKVDSKSIHREVLNDSK